MNINRSNYEPFLIDYLDGVLSSEERAFVEAFLLENADIQTEFNELSKCFLPTDELDFEFKAELKVQDEMPRTTLLMLQAMDDQLTSRERMELELALNDPQVAKEFQLLKTTILQPPKAQLEYKDVLKMPAGLTSAEEHELINTKDFPILSAGQEMFPHKEILRFDEVVNMNEPGMMAAACAEGDVLDMAKHVANRPELKAEIEQIQKMRLKPSDLVFEEKNSLKRKETPVILFTPFVKRAMAIAAVFLLGITIWRPWEAVSVVPSELATHQDMNAPEQADEIAKGDEGESMNKENDQLTPEADQINKGNLSQPRKPKVAPRHENKDVAVMQPIEAKEESPKEHSEIPPSPLDEAPEEIAEQMPSDTPDTPYIPIAKEVAMNSRNAKEPLTVLAFIGDKIENRFEHSAVYSYIDKKRKAIFESENQSEPIRYERVSSQGNVKQKLVLWGMEVQRNKRKR